MTPPRLTEKYFYGRFKDITGCRMDYDAAVRQAIQYIVSEARAEGMDIGARNAQESFKSMLAQNRLKSAENCAKLLKAQFDAGVNLGIVEGGRIGYEKGFAEGVDAVKHAMVAENGNDYIQTGETVKELVAFLPALRPGGEVKNE